MNDTSKSALAKQRGAFPADVSSIQKAALIAAHPGHELRAFGWLKSAAPQVCVLTDGSGRNQVSRLASTEKILAATGSRTGPIFGRFTDRQIYQALLTGETDIFINLAEELASWIILERFDYVLGDAAEGYNSTHDLCQMLMATACLLAGAALGKAIPYYDFLLVGHPASTSHTEAWRLTLADDVLDEKLAFAHAYHAISGDVHRALDDYGAEAFRVEIFSHADQTSSFAPPVETPPFYERYGQEQVLAGHYRAVIRYEDHLRPLAQSLQNHLTGAIR